MIFQLPHENSSQGAKTNYEKDAKSDDDKVVTYSMFLKNLRCFITLVGCSMVNILIDFLNSILSVELANNFGLGEATIGFIFAIPFFVYVLGFYFVSKIVVRFDKRISILISFIISSVSLFLTGPSQLLEIPE